MSRWKRSSSGANCGQYKAKNTACRPRSSRCFNQIFDRWIELLSNMRISISFPSFWSSQSNLINFVTYSLKLENYWSFITLEKNISQVDVMESTMDTDLLKWIFSTVLSPLFWTKNSYALWSWKKIALYNLQRLGLLIINFETLTKADF